jgi:polyisoprenoid-binding protein YceI
LEQVLCSKQICGNFRQQKPPKIQASVVSVSLWFKLLLCTLCASVVKIHLRLSGNEAMSCAAANPGFTPPLFPRMKNVTHFLSIATLALGLIAPARAALETYAIDPEHSAIGFSIRHVFTKIPGSFTKFSGTITVDRTHLENAAVEAAIDLNSLDTRSTKRDTAVRGPDFLDVAKHPSMTFRSKSWRQSGDDTYDVTGDLTIKNVTRQVVLQVKLLGFGPGLMGAYVSGWEVTTKLNRRDFGVNGPSWLGAAVGDEVAVSISIEADLRK